MVRKAAEHIDPKLGIKKLSNSELKFMEIIWENPDGISSEELYRYFPQALGTKTTIMHRIVKKGLVSVTQKGHHYWYTPKISKLEYEQAIINSKLKETFGIGSFENMIAAFCGRKKLSEEEKQRIEALLRDLENE